VGFGTLKNGGVIGTKTSLMDFPDKHFAVSGFVEKALRHW